MSTRDIRASVEKVVTEAMTGFGFETDDLTTDALLEDLGVSSLDAVELIQIARDDFRAEIQAPELIECKTLGDVIDLIAGRAAIAANGSTESDAADPASSARSVSQR